VLLGILGVSIFNTFIYIGMHGTTVTNTVLVNAINPVLIVIVSWLGFNDRISLVQIAGIVISFLGLIWIITRGNPAAVLALQFARSDLWILAAAFSWALYTVLLRQYPSELDSKSFLTALFIAGLIFLLPFYIFEFLTTKPITLNAASISGTVYLSIFPSIFAYIFWYKGVRAVGANKAGVFNYFIPVVSIVLAYFIFDERFKSYHLPGIFFIFFGIFLTTYFGNKNPS
jgi:drug/metabolite transporter (DMT)-like permease